MERDPDLKEYLRDFRFTEDGGPGELTRSETFDAAGLSIERFVNEFWTSKQRRGSSLHEISYRACFKPQLPRFFIERFSKKGDTVLDPFSGRGTTIIEAALLGRNVISNDVNPLSTILCRPRLEPPTLREVKGRLSSIDLSGENVEEGTDLSMFYHPRTLSHLVSLRNHLLDARRTG
ncbi:MAG: DNA methyltransferase, partial [Thermoplasmatota archaeon]